MTQPYREGILQAFSAYSLAIGRHEWHRLVDAFAPDGVWALADGSEFRGIEAITECAQRGAEHAPADCLHQVFNVFVRTDGDAAEADSDWIYCGRTSSAPWGILSWGHYRDRLVRTKTGWRIGHRRIVRRLEN